METTMTIISTPAPTDYFIEEVKEILPKVLVCYYPDKRGYESAIFFDLSKEDLKIIESHFITIVHSDIKHCF